MAEMDEMLGQIKEVFDVELEIDFDSADKAEDDKKEHVRDWLGYGALRSMVYSSTSGLQGLLEDSEMGPWFKEKTSSMKILFDSDVKRELAVKWEGDCFLMRWGQGILNSSRTTVYYIRNRVQSSLYAHPLLSSPVSSTLVFSLITHILFSP
jgi:hypothetical protein